jgi:pyridoxamine 5'-phosphate oxidase
VAEFDQPLREQDLDPDPWGQFSAWFAAASAHPDVRAPEAAALATATADGRPSVRMVLVKQCDPRGVVFYSNYMSRKGRELAENPRATVMFNWDPLGRQVRIEGPVGPTSAAESAAYVRSRPRASQLSALASPQSTVVPDREWLESRVAELDAAHAGAELPVPDFWGGFRLTPEMFEFWQHRADRLHDRALYTREGGEWRIVRLAP